MHWLLANTWALTVSMRDGKTYYRVTNRHAFREGAGRLLAEGTPADLRAAAGGAPSLEEAFLRLVAGEGVAEAAP